MRTGLLAGILILSILSGILAPSCTHGQTKAASQAAGESIRNLPCDNFKWVSSEGNSKAAILVPISLDGKQYWYQLDTGADATISYGAAKVSGWTYEGRTVRIPHVKLGDIFFSSIRAYPKTDVEPDADVQGTVGLDLLVGHIAILDFVHQRFCLVDSGEVPLPVFEAPDWAPAEIRHGKLFVDMELDGHEVDQIFYDTGSSPSALQVDLGLWKELTRKTGTKDATMRYHAPSWGRETEVVGAPAVGNLTLAKLVFPHPMIETMPARPTSFSKDSKARGLIGNALFVHKIIVLDLRAYPTLSILDGVP